MSVALARATRILVGFHMEVGRGYIYIVGDAFQFINHISAVCLQPALCLFHTSDEGLAGHEPTTYINHMSRIGDKKLQVGLG